MSAARKIARRKMAANYDWLMRQSPERSAKLLAREDLFYETRQAARENHAANDRYNQLRADIAKKVEAELGNLKKPSVAYQHGLVKGGAEGISWAVCAVIGFLRDGYLGPAFGRKRLEKFIAGINAYMDDLRAYKITGEDIAVALKDEIGIDLDAEFAKADKATQEAKKCRNTAS